MRFFKSCRRVKQPRAREMLFRVVFHVNARFPAAPGAPNRDPLQKKAPENSESETNP